MLVSRRPKRLAPSWDNCRGAFVKQIFYPSPILRYAKIGHSVLHVTNSLAELDAASIQHGFDSGASMDPDGAIF